MCWAMHRADMLMVRVAAAPRRPNQKMKWAGGAAMGSSATAPKSEDEMGERGDDEQADNRALEEQDKKFDDVHGNLRTQD